jgi:1,4-alpha-glucan branching enzyme
VGTTHTTHHGSTVDPVDAAAMDAIVQGTHGAPFDVLGPHRVGAGDDAPSAVRAFLPGARAAWVVPLADSSQDAPAPEQARVAMRRLHPRGFFSAILSPLPGPGRYVLETEYDDGSHRRTHDPYAFGPLLSEFDLHLLGEGTHYETYERMGAHRQIVNGITGIGFAVWAPNARRVSVVGDFNGWDERLLPMRLRSGGIWELFVPDLPIGTLYKYAVLSWNRGYRVLKADPYAFAAEVRPGTASRVWDLAGYEWSDADWLAERAMRDALSAPMTIYEVHAGSWRPDVDAPTADTVTYRGLAHQLVPYLKDMGYTHVELMPIAEHPFDGSWGYQVTGYFAPTSRYGAPQDFMYFVDYCHQHGIGVLLDWVPAHFPKDEHGLNYFDGSHLYEHADPRQGEHPDWGTLVFNYGRREVCNFLLANALFWLDKYHIDGLRVDAVASMLYLDYSRKAGEWLPNRYGGRENLDAIAFLRRFNESVYERFPGTVTIAEESTSWPLVSRPTYVGGLGFTFKWNMGWMHDVLHYASLDPVHRRFHHNELTFSTMYAFSENFILPFSHDEVVHLKGSMLTKMAGDIWQKFATLRALYAFMYGHPGKKLQFMGGEFGQWSEWNYADWLSWFLLGPAGEAPSLHAQLQQLVRDLNALLRRSPALYEVDFDPEGFEWIDANDADNSVFSFMRRSADGHEVLIIVSNFTPVPRYGYRIGVPEHRRYAEVLNTDAAAYGGSNVGNLGSVTGESIPMHGRPYSVALTLPPLATLILRAMQPPSAPAVLVARLTAETVNHVPDDGRAVTGSSAEAPENQPVAHELASKAPTMRRARSDEHVLKPSSTKTGGVDAGTSRATPKRETRKRKPATPA